MKRTLLIVLLRIVIAASGLTRKATIRLDVIANKIVCDGLIAGAKTQEGE